jgi:beta-galactosidase
MERTIANLATDWLFKLGDHPAAKEPSFDDDEWEEVTIPHDWTIEGPFKQFRNENWHMMQNLDHRIGYLPQGIGWYRKKIQIPKEYEGNRVVIQFDGVYRNAEVWINGEYLGKRPYGYTTFYYDITAQVKFGAENVIAVRVDNYGVSSRWYTGSGIYRKVTIMYMSPIHVAQWGVVWTTPRVGADMAQIQLKTTILNESTGKHAKCELLSELCDGETVIVSHKAIQVISAGKTNINQGLTVLTPKLWSPTNPNLYRIKSSVFINGELVDVYWTPIGFRSFKFDPNNGFILNGESVKIKGVCLHHDNGCLGAKEYEWALRRKLSLLQKMGCNAIRTSHNPPSQEMIELCDQMGFLVMDEIFDEWTEPKTPYGYTNHFNEWYERDVRDFVQRDRNHPCVIMWSCGNEVPEQKSKAGVEVLEKLIKLFHEEDPTRPVTQGCNNMKEANEMGFAQLLDIAGYNYYGDRVISQADPKQWFGTPYKCMYDLEHETYPKRILLGSENVSAYNTRGVYHFPIEGVNTQQENEDFHCSAYDVKTEIPLQICMTRPYVAGMFTWEGWDYIGEPTPYPWPARSSQYGIVDLAGFPKDTYYLYQSQWKPEPMVHIVGHWNWHADMKIEVWVYSNCDSVELFLNGRSLGEKNFKDEDYSDLLHLFWEDVQFEPGELKAIGKNKGQEVVSKSLVTTKSPHHLAIESDRQILPKKGDIAFLTVSVRDINNNIVPDAHNLITFTVKGPGHIIGTDNGNPISHECFTDQQRHAFMGLALGVVESQKDNADITIKVCSANLHSATISLNKK